MNSRSRQIVLQYGIAVIGLCVAATFIPKGLDVLWINGHFNPSLDSFFRSITHLGNGIVFLIPLVLLLFVQFRMTLLTIGVWISHGVLCAILKRVIFPHLSRPTNVIDNNLLHFVPGVDVHALHSFPSGHTATIFSCSLFIALCLQDRRVGALMLIVSLVVGYSRIYLLHHFLIDVAAGAMVGVATAVIWWWVLEKTNFLRSRGLNRKLEITLTQARSGQIR